jgi:FkbM family methyltransferase
VKQAIKQLATLGLQGDINAALKYRFRSHIRNLGKAGNIRTVYDIGAHRGNWSRGMKKLLPTAEFYLFEANPSCQTQLASTGFPFFLNALSRCKEKKTFYSADTTGDSFYRENSKLSGLGNWPEKQLDTTDLDSLVKERGLPPPDWIKLDVQGSELDIFAGGKKAFSQASFVLCEVPMISYNLGAPSLSEVLQAFSEAGFQPGCLVEMHQIPNRNHGKSFLCQLDIFFERG